MNLKSTWIKWVKTTIFSYKLKQEILQQSKSTVVNTVVIVLCYFPRGYRRFRCWQRRSAVCFLWALHLPPPASACFRIMELCHILFKVRLIRGDSEPLICFHNAEVFILSVTMALLCAGLPPAHRVISGASVWLSRRNMATTKGRCQGSTCYPAHSEEGGGGASEVHYEGGGNGESYLLRLCTHLQLPKSDLNTT